MSFSRFPQHGLAVELLQKSLRAGRVAHGYLFSGDSLEELEAIARTLAQTLNCEARLSGALIDDCCGVCRVCKNIEAEGHVDIHWVRPESKSRIIPVQQMRELMQEVHLKPTEATFKVAVIVAADRLTTESANAFLKTLEEPPPGSVIVLLTTEPSQLLETILSRCLRLSFGAVGSRGVDIENHRNHVEGFATALVTGEGKVIDRYRLLSALVGAFSQIRSQVEESLTAKSPLTKYEDADAKVRSRWEDELGAAIEAGYRHQRFLCLLAVEWWLRDVWMVRLGGDLGMLMFPEFRNLAERLAQRLSSDEALANIQVLEGLQRQLASNVQEALALEVGVLRLKS